MTLRYDEHPLSPPLARFVECVWFLRASSGEAPGPERIVPDGCPELIFQLADPCLAGRAGEPLRLQPKALLVGPLTSSLMLAPSGAVATMGIRFRPGGLAALLPVPLDELADRQIPLDELFGADAGRLQAQLLEAGSDAGRVRVAVRYLLARLAQRGGGERPVEHAVRRMVRRRGPVPIERLAGELGWTRRHLERRFRAETGMSPLRLGRVIRFQNVFRAMASGGGDWISVALDCGYYDQSHLIRDFREFAGASPGVFAGEDGTFGKVFVSPARLDRFFS